MESHLTQHLLGQEYRKVQYWAPHVSNILYINVINENITSSMWLLADDCIIYKTITMIQDAEQLQDDLCKICEWTNKWQMKLKLLNVDKCVVLRCTCSQSPIQYMYTFMDHINLEIKRLHKYLSVKIDHRTAYLTLVKLMAEYAALVCGLWYWHNQIRESTKKSCLIDFIWLF